MLEIVPCDLDEANTFVRLWHRHHGPVRGYKFAIAVADGESVRGVAIVGRPNARTLQDGWTLEVTRVATDGARNAPSMLYAGSWRVARSLGYRRLLTYTLKTEPGTSLIAAGWRLVAETRGGSWDRKARPRVDKHPTQGKMRWEISK